MGVEFTYIDGQTPLSDEEKEGLKIKSVSTHGELDEFEQLNIEKAVEWTVHASLTPEKILSEKFVKQLHSRMYGDVWKWAGQFRRSQKNLGIAWTQIGVEFEKLLGDTKFWIEHQSFSPEEIAIRFKHRIVSIHCFSNGNGRHSRIMADIILESVFGKEAFTWSQSNMVKPDETRKAYIDALRKADNGDIHPLIMFAKS